MKRLLIVALSLLLLGSLAQTAAPAAEGQEAAAKAPKLEIMKAVYGDLASGKIVDVTEKIKGMITPDGLSVLVSNILFGDPAAGVVKQLKVEYKLDGKELEKIVGENETLVLGQSTAAAKAGKGLRVFHIGNSFTDQAYGMHNIAVGKGYTDVLWGRQMIPGAPIRWLWDHRNEGMTRPLASVAIPFPPGIQGSVATYLETTAVDALVMQIFPQNGDSAQAMIDCGGNYAEAAYKGNPDCQVYIFGSYPFRNVGDKYDEVVAQYDKMAVDAAVGISKRFPDRKPALVVPVAQAFQAFLKNSEKTGGVMQLYEDLGHTSDPGRYLESLVHFATIYKQNPHGAITSGLYFWRAPYSVSADFAAIAQEVAWDVVLKHPLSGVKQASPAEVKP